MELSLILDTDPEYTKRIYKNDLKIEVFGVDNEMKTWVVYTKS